MTQPQLTPDQIYRAADIITLLRIGRSTFYRIAWFKSRKVKLTSNAVGWTASDVALYQAICQGKQ